MLIRVEFSSFAVDRTNAMPLIILRAVNSPRFIPLPAGPLEASIIALHSLGLRTEKPLTIDMAKSILEGLSGTLARVILEPDSPGGAALSATLEILSPQGIVRRITARPCDAVALALRSSAPIFARESAFSAMAVSGSPEKTDEGKTLRDYVSSIDTIEFGSHYLE